jgi:RNA polymerase sigma-70 factor (ECF subfamily)
LLAPELVRELFRTCDAAAWSLTEEEFKQIVLRIGMSRNFGLPEGLAAEATGEQQARFFAGLKLADLVLARACAGGSERAWEHFIALYRQPLLRAAIAITGSDTVGRELADGLYAELYGLTVRDGRRRCPLESYSGRGSLIGWLRTTLAQRHVDHYRRTYRELPLDQIRENEAGEDKARKEVIRQLATPAADAPEAAPPAALSLLVSAVQEALEREGPEERFLLASYYLDGRTLHQVAALLGVHEATVSRKLKRATTSVRNCIIHNLERTGMSRRAAQEALAIDPRDLTAARGGTPSQDAGGIDRTRLRLKELLQTSAPGTFHRQAYTEQAGKEQAER